MMEKVKQELSEYKQICVLLLKGKGSLSDYLLVATNIALGLLTGYGIWG
tara:strand:- start:113 stop:259 length:147 start_codon:yes stop_codon:yes gene_type:complete